MILFSVKFSILNFHVLILLESCSISVYVYSWGSGRNQKRVPFYRKVGLSLRVKEKKMRREKMNLVENYKPLICYLNFLVKMKEN